MILGQSEVELKPSIRLESLVFIEDLLENSWLVFKNGPNRLRRRLADFAAIGPEDCDRGFLLSCAHLCVAFRSAKERC